MLGNYLMFNRNCAEALEVYAQAFDTPIVKKMRYGEASDPGFPVAEADKDLIIHSLLVIDGMDLMCADATESIQVGDNFYITFTSSDADAVYKAWDVLKIGGKVRMELAPSFFAAAHGSLQDRFGINWMFTLNAQ